MDARSKLLGTLIWTSIFITAHLFLVEEGWSQAWLGPLGDEQVEFSLGTSELDRLLARLEESEQSLEQRLERLQAQADWSLRRLFAQRGDMESISESLRQRRAVLNPLEARTRRRKIADILQLVREINQATQQLEDAFYSHMSSLTETATMARHLRILLETHTQMARNTSVDEAELQIRELEELQTVLTNRRRDATDNRAQLARQQAAQREALENARENLLRMETRTAERVVFREDSEELGRAVGNAVVSSANDGALPVAENRQSRFQNQLRADGALMARLTISRLVAATPISYPALGAERILSMPPPAVAILVHYGRAERYLAFNNARLVVSEALAGALRFAQGEGLVEEPSTTAQEEIERLDLLLAQLAVRNRERQIDLMRERLEGLDIRLERISLQYRVYEHLLGLWRRAREQAAARALGGILNRQPSAFSAEQLRQLTRHASRLLAEPSLTYHKFNLALGSSARQPLTIWRTILLLLSSVGSLLVSLLLLRASRRITPRSGNEKAALVAMKAAIRPLFLVTMLAVAMLLSLIPLALHALGWTIVIAIPLFTFVWAGTKQLFSKEADLEFSSAVARYLRSVIRLTLLSALLTQFALVMLPLLEFTDNALQPLRGLLVLILMAAWLGILARKNEALRITSITTRSGEAIGPIRASIKRFYIVLMLGPMVMGTLYLIGYQNLAVVAFVRMFLILAVLILTPWVHQSSQRLIARWVGHPGGGGPLALSERSSLASYRVLSPLVTVFIGLLALGLMASGWGYRGNILLNLWAAMTYSLFSVGSSSVSLVSIALFILTIILTFLVSNWTRNWLNSNLYPLYDLTEGMRASIDNLVKYVVVFVGIIIGLRVIGLGLGFFAVFAGVIGIGIGFGSQTLAANFIAGLILQFTRPIAVGDIIEVEGILGIVKRITSHATVVKTFDNLAVIVPNASLVAQKVVNWTKDEAMVRIQVNVGVSYGSDVELVTKLLFEAAEDHPLVRAEPNPTVVFQDFGDSSLDFTLTGWIDNPSNGLRTRSEIRYRIIELFRKHEVEIPFPQRDLHLRSSEATLELARGRGWDVSLEEEQA